MQSVYVDGTTKTFTANGAVLANRRVKLSAGSATHPPQVEYAGAGEACIGVALTNAATTELVTVKLLASGGTFLIKTSNAVTQGAPLYGTASGCVDDAGTGTTQFVSLDAASSGDTIECALYPAVSTTAATVSIADAGTFTATTTVEAALQEIYQSLLTAKGIIDIPTPAFSAAGVALAAFSDGASDVPGYCVTAKGLGIRWNNHAAPLAVGAKVIVPPDADVTANMVLHILAAKTGATEGDATKFTVGAYNNDVGAAYDADDTFGGDTSAMTGTAVAKTVQEVTLTLALANLTAYPAAIELTIKPKDGTLGTDDVILLASWIEYKKKLLTS